MTKLGRTVYVIERVDMSEARANLGKLVRRVRSESTVVIITRYGRDMAMLMPPGDYVRRLSDNEIEPAPI